MTGKSNKGNLMRKSLSAYWKLLVYASPVMCKRYKETSNQKYLFDHKDHISCFFTEKIQDMKTIISETLVGTSPNNKPTGNKNKEKANKFSFKEREVQSSLTKYLFTK
ncbi:MAG: hypothetical protein D6799_05520 [Bacteroidetes bacterium]|nr:MAG: hypothetical protein D6799_05520 [Bacteroidota bacterium]